MFRLCLFRLKDTFSQWPSEDEWWTKTFLLNLEQFWLIHERFVYMCFCLCFSHWFEVGVARLNYWKYYVICQYVLALIKGFATFNWTVCCLVCHEDLISSKKNLRFETGGCLSRLSTNIYSLSRQHVQWCMVAP